MGSGWSSLSGPMAAGFSAKERLLQHMLAAPGALSCRNSQACCSCWHPLRGRYCWLLFVCGLCCAQTASWFLAPHLCSSARCAPWAHGRVGRCEAGARSSHDKTSRAVSRLGVRKQPMISALTLRFEFGAANFVSTLGAKSWHHSETCVIFV